MARLEPAVEEHLLDLTTDLVLCLRAQYLAGGASALKHWDQLAERLRAATRTSSTAEAWATRLCRDLLVAVPSAQTSAAMEALVLATRRHGAVAWLALVEREWAYVMARARRLAEERREERLAAKEA